MSNEEQLAFEKLMEESMNDEIMIEESSNPVNMIDWDVQPINLEESSRATDVWYAEHYNLLTKNLADIDLTGWYNSLICIFGEKSFPITLNSNRASITTAGALFGLGRVVAMGRIEYLESSSSKQSNQDFILNAVAWLSNNAANVKIASGDGTKLIGYDDTELNVAAADLATRSDIRVYKVNARTSLSDTDVSTIQTFVYNGGSLIIGGQAWSFPGSAAERINGYPGNKILVKMGIAIQGFNRGNGVFNVRTMPVPEYNILNALIKNPSTTISTNTLSSCLKEILSVETASNPDIQTLFKNVKTQFESMDAINNRIEYSTAAQSFVPIIMANDNIVSTDIPVASDVATFPYNVPDGSNVEGDIVLKINGNYDGYPKQFGYSQAESDLMVSTALYCKAGSLTTVTIPTDKIGKVKILIGSHTDKLYHVSQLKRSPEITFRYKTSKETTKVTNPWGGLIYILIPWGSSLGEFDVTINGGIKAPYFVYGKTTNEEWNTSIKNNPAPWTELEIPGQLIFTYPTEEARKLKNPNELLEMYNRAMITANNLSGFEGGNRPRPERFVVDVQIGGGWMHSGYPVMGYLAASAHHLDLEDLNKGGTWGIYHELGHNMQWNSWTIPNTTQSGCNFWALVMNEETYGIPRQHSATKESSVFARIHDFIMKGRKRENWQGWLSYDTYVILALEFGWDSYTSLFKKYFEMDSISSNEEKLDTWARLYSIEVNTNLCTYFEWFGWILSDETKQVCASLPNWKSDPLIKYEQPTEHRTCLEGWTPYGQSCFFFSEDKLGLSEAEAKCAEVQGSHVASCLSRPESKFLASKIPSSIIYRIGLSDLDNHEGVFKYNDGTTAKMTDLPWQTNKPNPSDNRHCGIYYSSKIYDWLCQRKERFICKIGQTSCAPVYTCPDNWVPFNGRCYYFNSDRFIFSQAKKTCTDFGGDSKLVEINSKEEQSFLEHYVEDLYAGQKASFWRDYWIGLERDDNGSFGWISGAPFGYQDAWCEGQPDGTTGNVVLWRRISSCWDDTTTYRNGFICEASAPV